MCAFTLGPNLSSAYGEYPTILPDALVYSAGTPTDMRFTLIAGKALLEVMLLQGIGNAVSAKVHSYRDAGSLRPATLTLSLYTKTMSSSFS